MAVQQLAATTNFVVHYEDTTANAQDHAVQVGAVCDYELNVLNAWFGIHNAFGPTDRINVFLEPIGGGFNHEYWSGGRSEIHVTDQRGSMIAENAKNEIVKSIFVAELVEILMSYNNKSRGAVTWNASDSAGEGLSQLCSIERYRTGHYLAYRSVVDAWLQSNSRPDRVTPRVDRHESRKLRVRAALPLLPEEPTALQHRGHHPEGGCDS